MTLAGEANLDLLFYGLPDDLPADRELIADSMALTLGGSPAITAHNLAALGNRTGFITAASDDLFASMCISDLTGRGRRSLAHRPVQSCREHWSERITAASQFAPHSHVSRQYCQPTV